MDEVKVTIIGVPREQRLALKQACLLAETSISAELRKRLPVIIKEIQGKALTYTELTELMMSMIGIVNLALDGRGAQARDAMQQIRTELSQFRLQIKGELRSPYR